MESERSNGNLQGDKCIESAAPFRIETGGPIAPGGGKGMHQSTHKVHLQDGGC